MKNPSSFFEDDVLILDEERYQSAMIDVWSHITQAEERIDHYEPIYMFTWSPDPAKIPVCSFYDQHDFLRDCVFNLMKYVYAGAACLEPTQKGNPHYHGWYQIWANAEEHRIVMMKVMQRYGQVLINEVQQKPIKELKEGGRISWTNPQNPLYYYKKDATQAMLYIDWTPIICPRHLDDTYDDYWEFADTMKYTPFIDFGAKRTTVEERENIIKQYTASKEFFSQRI